ncbi:MAG: hypothetical protein H6668_15360 [Ardenticatenaceae bacterium]|nr:hypothetical protein [Ardenticatenaceae bacterium]
MTHAWKYCNTSGMVFHRRRWKYSHRELKRGAYRSPSIIRHPYGDGNGDQARFIDLDREQFLLHRKNGTQIH